MKKNVTRCIFECPCCSTQQIAYKKSNRMTKAKHIKTMYCWKCNDVNNFVQLSRYYC